KGITAFIQDGDLTPAQYELLRQGRVEAIPREVVEGVVRRCLTSGPGGACLNDEAELLAQHTGMSIEEARAALFRPHVETAILAFARTNETSTYREDPRFSGSGDSGRNSLLLPDQTGLTLQPLVGGSDKYELDTNLGREISQRERELQRAPAGQRQV